MDPSISHEYLRPLEAKATLARIHSFLALMDDGVQAGGRFVIDRMDPHTSLTALCRKALRALLANSERDPDIVQEAMRLAFITMKELDTSGMRFFEVVADVIVNSTAHGFSFPQIICLGLFNLSHPGARARNLALQILEECRQDRIRAARMFLECG